MSNETNPSPEQEIEAFLKDIPLIGASQPLVGHYVFHDDKGGELLRITEKAFIFRGEAIEDAGAAHAAFMLAINSHNERYQPRRHLHISFADEQDALNKPPSDIVNGLVGKPMSVRASELIEEEVTDPPGQVRIYRKRDDWFMSMATEKKIANTIADVRAFLNEKNPVPFTEQQLEHIIITKDQRRQGKRLLVQVRIGDLADIVTVAFLSGPLADYPTTE